MSFSQKAAYAINGLTKIISCRLLARITTWRGEERRIPTRIARNLAVQYHFESSRKDTIRTFNLNCAGKTSEMNLCVKRINQTLKQQHGSSYYLLET